MSPKILFLISIISHSITMLVISYPITLSSFYCNKVSLGHSILKNKHLNYIFF